MSRDVHEVTGADPGGEQGLVGVAERGLGDPDGLLRAQVPGPLLGSDPEQQVPGTRWGRCLEVDLGELVAGGQRGDPGPVGLVDRHLCQICQQLGAAVSGHPGGQQGGMILDE